MAIFHLTANVVSRARGQSVVAAAAYRMGATLRDERYGGVHRYLGKRGIVHAEILTPPDAPPWMQDRQQLWNRVEAGELRKDSQLARLIEVALPIELTSPQHTALMRDYLTAEFVAHGMVADYCIRGTANNPHAHVLLTLRRVTEAGFGPKERQWNGKAALLGWRSARSEHVNEALARAGHVARIDHRTLAAQQLELAPVRRIGLSHRRVADRALPEHLTQRVAEQERIARENGEILLEDPTVALRALTQHQAVFDDAALERFLRSRTQGAGQFAEVLAAIRQSSELVVLPGTGSSRYTSQDMIDAAKSLHRRAASMVTRRGHGIPAERRSRLRFDESISDPVRRALDHLTDEGDVKALAAADVDKPSILHAARGEWQSRGFAVRGATASRAAAERLHAASGIESQSLPDWEAEWQAGRELTRDTVLVVDGADLLGLKQAERALAAADRPRALAVFIGALDRMVVDVDSPLRTLMRITGAPLLRPPDPHPSDP